MTLLQKAGDGDVDPDLFNAVVDAVNTGGGGGGGIDPVSCLLSRDAAIDMHDAGVHTILWDALYNNPSQYTPLLAVPTGLGLTFAFNGSGSTLTTTEAGVWAFTYSVAMAPDASWSGDLTAGSYTKSLPVSAAFTPPILSEILPLPTGVVLAQTITTTVEATADPYPVSVELVIVRLG